MMSEFKMLDTKGQTSINAQIKTEQPIWLSWEIKRKLLQC
jgi:hypothetical protein